MKNIGRRDFLKTAAAAAFAGAAGLRAETGGGANGAAGSRDCR